MDRGTERETPPGRGAGDDVVLEHTAAGRVPLAVILVDRAGLVSHWSRGARRLFGVTKEEAIGQTAVDLLPVSGALPDDEDTGSQGVFAHYDGLGPDLESSLDGRLSYPAAGRARLTVPERSERGSPCPKAGEGPRGRPVVGLPLVGPGQERLLVLAADAGGLRQDLPGTDGAFERIAPGFALHTDFPGADELARRLPEILPSMSVGESARIVGQVLELGYPVLEFSQNERVPVTPDWGVARRAERRARRERAALAAAEGLPLPDDLADEGEDLEYAAVRDRLEFLNEVSGRIGTSLDLAQTIIEVSKAVVPKFTDVAGTYLREQVVRRRGVPGRRARHHHHVAPGRPGAHRRTRPLGRRRPRRRGHAVPRAPPFFQCMTSGDPVLVPRISEQMGHMIASQFEKRDIRPLITGRSMLVVPLKARNVVLGFMILLRHPERVEFNDMDRVTGAELAARAGLVLDNARMYTYQESVAETLQDSMLPHIPPRMAGCDIATRYLPGTLLGRVGGDWFDSVKLPGARTALVVGDVMGHGLNSAAMMGQLRTAVQTMAAMDLPPAQLLRNLDDLAQRLGDSYLATCLYVVYDPIAGELHLANAGHIPPVIVHAGDGRSELLDLPTGAPIGVGGVPFETIRIRVEPGDRLVMCTDGLVEVRGEDIGVGLATLSESAAHPAASMDDACDTIIRSLNTRGGRKDDVALLMARLNGIEPDDVAEWRLTLDPAEAGRARAAVGEQLHAWGLARLADTTALLAGELVTNAVRHSRGRGSPCAWCAATPCCARWTTTTPPCPPCSRRAPMPSSAGACTSSASSPANGAPAVPPRARPSVWFELTLPRR